MKIYNVKSGDDIYTIAQNNEIKAEHIIDDNELSGSKDLTIGQSLVIRDLGKKRIITNGFAYPFTDYDTLYATLPYLTFLSSFSYHTDSQGNLTLINDESIRNMAKNQSVATLMVITNIGNGNFDSEIAHSILTNEKSQDNLINNILETTKSRNFYGINIDFEYINPEDKELYNNFIKKISEILHTKNLLLTTSLAPKTYKNQPGILYEAHDYEAHGKYADYVILMTYEWGYSYGPPMAVAPLNQVERVLNYAITEIPSQKILMGIPNYGYDWTLPYEKGKKATSISNTEAVEIAKAKGSTIEFDNIAMAPYFYYTDNEGNKHVVWFEDARSIEAKLKLVEKYNLGGVSYWNINKMFNQNWLVLDNMYKIDKAINL